MKGDPEQLHMEFEKYMDIFKDFLTATEVDEEHNADHDVVDHLHCGGCKKAKAYLKLIGGSEMKNLFEHVGKVVAEDIFDEAITKIKDGMTCQTNQATA